MSAGGRVQTFAFGSRLTATPRISTGFALSPHTSLHASFGRYNQLPPFLDMLSYPGNRFLSPIKVRQLIAGIDAYRWSHGSIGVEAYQKNYADYPVSTEYPSLSLANMVDTLGQEFIWIPLTSAGRGLTRGVELSTQMRLGGNIFLQANAAYERSLFSGLDNVMRPGNFDYPLVANAAGSYRFARRYEVSARYEYTTGRPYTPFQLQESGEQNRPIYNLNLINAVRGPFYSRLDFQASRTFSVGAHKLAFYGGLENAFNRTNFLGYAWMPRAELTGYCRNRPAYCVSTQDQMGRFPNFGAKYVF
jgi:outer membrane cobalamin receptor